MEIRSVRTLTIIFIVTNALIFGESLDDFTSGTSDGLLTRKLRSPISDQSDLFDNSSDESNEMMTGRVHQNNSATQDNFSDFEILSLPKNYNKLELPISKNHSFVYVEVSIFIRSILEINELTEELLLDADLGFKWADWKIYEHLKETGFKDSETGKLKNNITLDSEALKKIWRPDVYIDEMASLEKTSILSKLITLKFLGNAGVQDSGDIVYSARNTLRLRCDMDFKYYPADIQTCSYHLRSYSYYESELKVFWNEPIGIFLDDPTDPNFDLQIESAEPKVMFENFYIHEKFNQYREGNYSALRFIIKARRKLSYHIVQTYLPSILLIFITWLCFLLPADMVEARIGISMTTVLTLTAMFSSVRAQSPTVSYTMAIDIWMVFCIFFVFLALLLFTVIYWMKSRLVRHKESQQQRLNKSTIEEEEVPEPDISGRDKRQTYERIVFITKHYAFGVFSIVFISFIITYWTWLLLCSGYSDWNPSASYNAISEFDTTGRNDGDVENDDTQLYLYRWTPKIEKYTNTLNNITNSTVEDFEMMTNVTDSIDEVSKTLMEIMEAESEIATVLSTTIDTVTEQ